MFDPYNIYKRQTHSSHSGQVLRKKIRRKSGKVYTNEELESVVPVLKSLGYNVFKGKYYSTQITSWSDTYVLPTGSVTFPDARYIPFSFSSIWPDIKADFQDCLSIDPISVVNILFEIDLLTIDLYNSFNNSNSRFPSIYIYFTDSSQSINSVDPGITMDNPNNNFHVSFRSFSFSQVYLTESGEKSDLSYWGTYRLLTKKENTDSTYLNIIQRRQPAIITALRNDDYSAFDPTLFNIAIPTPPAAASSSFITIQVKMIVEHK